MLKSASIPIYNEARHGRSRRGHETVPSNTALVAEPLLSISVYMQNQGGSLQKGEYECNRSVSRRSRSDSAALRPTPPKDSMDCKFGLTRVREAMLVSKSMSIGSQPGSIVAKPWALLTSSHAFMLASDCKASLPLKESWDMPKGARIVESVPAVSELNEVAMESL